MPSPNVAVSYYSATGNTHKMAEAVAEGASDTGADVKLFRVEELAPAAAFSKNPAWKAHLEATKDIPVVTPPIWNGLRRDLRYTHAVRRHGLTAQAIHRHHWRSVVPGETGEQGGRGLRHSVQPPRRAGGRSEFDSHISLTHLPVNLHGKATGPAGAFLVP